VKHVLLFCLCSIVGFRACCQEQLQKISRGSTITVIIFLSEDCPISQKYVPAINAIQRKYHDRGVRIHAIIPGKIKKSDLTRFKEEYAITFPITRDKKYRMVQLLSATTTPEVFMFDRNLDLKYRGAIDNWFYELGGYRQEVTEDYLIEAIDALLAGGQPDKANTLAVGCLIQIPNKR
jgi:hypothetical protein